MDDHPAILTPDDILAGQRPEHGPVVIYDDDHYYLGGVIAELIAQSGQPVTLVTPGPEVSHWTQNTMEQHKISALFVLDQQRKPCGAFNMHMLLKAGVI